MAHDLEAVIDRLLPLMQVDVCAFVFASLSEVRIPTHGADCLSIPEQLQADQFSRTERQIYVRQRLIRRHVIAAFAGCLPAEVCYRHVGARPRLLGRHGLFFSVSHSCDVFAIVLSRVGDCGLDCEVWRPVRYKQRIAQRFFQTMSDNFYRSMIMLMQHSFRFGRRKRLW